MPARRLLSVSVILACIAAPIIIGASCPPPVAPPFFRVGTNDQGQSIVPNCVPGFVCISFANETVVPVDVVLYRHNGFDPQNLYPDPPQRRCCTDVILVGGCPCPCEGAEVGDCLLNRAEIFEDRNLSTINGQQIFTLAPGQSTLDRVRCGDVKTLAAAAVITSDDPANSPISAPADRNGPIYRDEPAGVACGRTIQFSIIDLADTGIGGGITTPDLVTLIIRADISR